MNVFITILTTRSYPHLRRGKKKTNVPWDCLQKSLFFFFPVRTSKRKERASLVAQMVKSLPALQETWVRSLGQEDSPEKEMNGKYTPVFLPEESHGQGSLASYSPWGRKELDTTE